MLLSSAWLRRYCARIFPQVHALATLVQLLVEQGAWPVAMRVVKGLLLHVQTAEVAQARHDEREPSQQGEEDNDSSPSANGVCHQLAGVRGTEPASPPLQPTAAATLLAPPLKQQQQGCNGCLVASPPAGSSKSVASASQTADEKDVTRLQLDYVQRCLQIPRRGPKYRSSFRHHKVGSRKVLRVMRVCCAGTGCRCLEGLQAHLFFLGAAL